jgi:hypothetical protein
MTELVSGIPAPQFGDESPVRAPMIFLELLIYPYIVKLLLTIFHRFTLTRSGKLCEMREKD